MALALVPLASDRPDRVHVWLGIADVAAPPALVWHLDGAVVEPRAVRPLEPVLTGDLAARAETTVYSGVFEFVGPTYERPARLRIRAGAESLERLVAPLPERVPTGLDVGFNVLVVSCFCREEDTRGTAGQLLASLKPRPDLTLFVGDQVYLDIPTTENFVDELAWLANRFQKSYLANWFWTRPQTDPKALPGGFASMLSLAPGAFLPDDHEYWNNFPFWAAVVQNSWTSDGRERWKRAADAVFRGFQRSPLCGNGATRRIEVPPLSILLLDTRSQRSMTSRDTPEDLLGDAGRDALTSWVDELVQRSSEERPRYGMLVTGQSLFSSAAGSLKGKLADYEFADYPRAYEFLVEQLQRLTQVGLPVVLVTGDVHWGRVLRADHPAKVGAAIYEVISSPTSLVSVVGVDQIVDVWGKIKDLFGAHDPFVRHAEPGNPPPRFGNAGEYRTDVLWRTTGKRAAMRGNQAYMLRFSGVGRGLDVDVTCYPLSGEPEFDATEQWSTRLYLRPLVTQ